MPRKKIKYLIENKSRILFIHYSCENLTDKNQELSPRITSIAVLFSNGHTLRSFSIHYTAEVMDIDRGEIEKNYKNIEKEMLSDFFKFAESKYDYIWLHWNMTNINYGFEALEHRYKVLLKKDAYHINEENRYNLSKLIFDKYGKKSVDDPKMENLMILNGGLHRDFLSGINEVNAFNNKEYLKMHKSTMCKVYWLSSIFSLFLANKVKTKRINWKLLTDKIFNHPLTRIISIASAIFTIIGFFMLITS